ncbi:MULTISPECIES: hypothetical protein [Legionella]|uniref:Tetratricopeptide repeat protein n=1 Tax=Legionella maceachernii TaxID=466 RepID=A0A0W0VZB2_9GAMM|nr:hypothetical protein [Legionella maceachernii]KTD25509.1 hypothetical protein Lmac_1873 [Legionella maceachernii]SJZ54826.1 hypothetical protein SAMN02745128_00357 [Legionella maceachernii]SUP00378.1 Uncharacterised protein [Legionella maceachernii]
MRLSYTMGLSIIVCWLTACEHVAVLSTPKKQAIASTSELAIKAQNDFWKTLHEGNYQDIPKVDYLLMAAYLQNPNDPQLAAHLGLLHLWKITERQRNKKESPTIVNEIILSRKYITDALQLDPKNPIYQGFAGDTQLIEGKIFHDKREETRAYFLLKKAIHHWPEFNYFTAGYPMTTLPPDSEQFQEALSWQWDTLDLCQGSEIDRKKPIYSIPENSKGQKRACFNSWIAPFGFEGFFMNMGDMLVKSGDWQTAIVIYNNAKLDKNYAQWPYREMLEKRIINAKENVANFQKEFSDPDKAIMFNSGYGCMVCHQSVAK